MQGLENNCDDIKEKWTNPECATLHKTINIGSAMNPWHGLKKWEDFAADLRDFKDYVNIICDIM